MQLISRKTTFDASHRVMNEKMKCFNQHGHLYSTTLTFSFEKIEEIGYALDFKEIKRVYCQWIDDMLDHAAIHNPQDHDFIAPCLKHKTKLWLMSLNGKGEYCNPSVENIAKEIFLAMEILTENYPLLKIHSVEIYETPNCFTTCFKESISQIEKQNWISFRSEETRKYAWDKGIVEYDDRKQRPLFQVRDDGATTSSDFGHPKKEEKYLSLYDFLGHAAGSGLGEQIAHKAMIQGIKLQTRFIDNPVYRGDVLLYPESFLIEIFKDGYGRK